MKKKNMFLLVTSVIVVLLLVWNAAISNSTEQRPYSIEKKYDGFEVRQYLPATLASVNKPGHMMESSNSGFRDLAGYIFGANKSEQKIAMTAPVIMQIGEGTGTTTEMSFVMPATYSLENLPVPEGENIRLHHESGYRMAVLRFGGYASNEDIAEKSDQLRQFLLQEKIAFRDKVIYMGYNPPFQLINRRNEVGFILKD